MKTITLAPGATALLLPIVDPIPEGYHLWLPAIEDYDTGKMWFAWSTNSQQGEKGDVTEREAPHAPGDVLTFELESDGSYRLLSGVRVINNFHRDVTVTSVRPVKLSELTEEVIQMRLRIERRILKEGPDFGEYKGLKLRGHPMTGSYMEGLKDHWTAAHPEHPFDESWAWLLDVTEKGE